MHKQRGMTMWGMAMVIALIAFFTLLGLKLTPPYLEYFKVRSILKSEQVKSMAGSREELMQTLDKRFDIDLVHSVNLKNDLSIEQRNGGKRVIRIAYQVRVPLVYNITALLDFNESVEVKGVE